MADVFISYAHTTAKQARGAASALRSLGYTVWLDDDLASHRPYTHAIEEQLNSAKAALVIWSADAARSEWVLSEANRAREDHKLVQLLIDNTRLPMPFDQIQCADLVGWSGEHGHTNWGKVVASIAELLGDAPGGAPEVSGPGHRSVAVPLLAVLAFDNLSGDAEMAYFSDGVSEEIQETVARGSDLKIIGRTSSFHLRGADKTVRKAALDLKATHVLDGSVRRSGKRVRISAQLIECAGETTLWSNRFDRDLTDIFALQDEIAAAVAAALKIAFAPVALAQPIDPAAYDLYLRARSVVLNVEPAVASKKDDPQVAADLYEQVVAVAPRFAAAWAGLAHARAHLLIRGEPDQSRQVTRAAVMEAVDTALALDPQCGLAYVALSLLEPFGRHVAREHLLSKALACAPNDPELLYKMSQHLFQVGRYREVLAYIFQVRELDPLYVPNNYSHAAMVEISDGQYEEAQRLFDAYRQRWPEYVGLTSLALNCAAWHRDWERFDALATYVRETGLNEELFSSLIRIGEAIRNPNPTVVASVGRGFRNQLTRTGSVRLDYISTAMALGLKEEVFAAIGESTFASVFENQSGPPAAGWSPGIIFMMVPSKEMIRDVRFIGLCAKLGLCEYWVETDKWPDCADEVDYDFRAESRRLADAHA